VITSIFRRSPSCLKVKYFRTFQSQYSDLSPDERVVVENAIMHFAYTTTTLELWARIHPRLRYLFVPVKSWLESQASISLSSHVDSTAAVENTDTVIDLFLVHVQSMLAACPESENKEEYGERDRYIEQDYHNVRNLTRLLKLNQTYDSLNDALRQLAIHGSDIQTNLQRLLPFLDLYLQLVHHQLTAHSEWTKALFKLDYVLCSVTQTIAKDGFCKPPDGDDAGTGGDTSEVSGGMGLGAGAGAENVSKEIEEESQVEGLKGDDDEGNDPKDRKDDDDDAIEMSEDIGGSLEDVPEDEESQDDKDSDRESDADPEEQLGDLDASDPSAVDEKLWGDEKGPQDSEDKDDKTNQDHSEEKSGNSEVVAKEGEQQQQRKEKQDGDEQTADQEPPPDAEDEAMAEGEEDQDNPADASGAPMDDYVQDANTLDLPDDLDLGLGEEMPDEVDMEEGPEDDAMDEDDPEPLPDTEPLKEQASRDEPPAGDAPDPLEGQEPEAPVQSGDAEDEKDAPEAEETPDEHAVAQPDVTAGEGEADPNNDKNEEAGESAATGQAGSSAGVAGEDTAASEEKSKDEEGCVFMILPRRLLLTRHTVLRNLLSHRVSHRRCLPNLRMPAPLPMALRKDKPSQNPIPNWPITLFAASATP
jgi:midasin